MNKKETYVEKLYRELEVAEDKKEVLRLFLLDNLVGNVNSDRKKCPYLSDKEVTSKEPTTMQAFARKHGLRNEPEEWYECLKEKFDLTHMKTVCTEERKKGFGSERAFFEWYIDQDLQCCYCGVSEQELTRHFNDDNPQYKDARKRGKQLEIERIITAPKEENVYKKDNCALACYICNNAKSDFLNVVDFEPIATGINKFWSKKIGYEIPLGKIYNKKK